MDAIRCDLWSTGFPAAPVRHVSDQFFVVTADRDIRWVLEHPAVFSSVHSVACRARGTSPTIAELDGPLHRRRRAVLEPLFHMHVYRSLRPSMRELLSELLDRVSMQTPPIDLIQAIMVPLSTFVLWKLMGIPREEAPVVQRWVAELTTTHWPAVQLLERWTMLNGMLTAAIDQRRTMPVKRPKDVISVLVESACSDHEIRSTLWYVLAMHEATTTLLTNVVYELVRPPRRWDQVCLFPRLIGFAIEEAARLHPPMPWLTRTCTEDTMIGGVPIPAGACLALLLSSANRDPERWPHPEAFIFPRREHTHLSFGYGEHFCLGAPLAREETALVLEMLCERFPGLRLAALVRNDQRPGGMVHRPPSLFVHLTPADADA